MVVVVCVCVLLLVTVLTVGVVRLRAAHKRAAEEEVEMAWDDTALNITVNPLEVSYTLIKKENCASFKPLPNRPGSCLPPGFLYTDKKRKSNFPHTEGNSEWSSCKVIDEKGLADKKENQIFLIYI